MDLPIPAHMRMNNTAHGHGDKGMAFYTYEDADGLGVLLDARRKDGRSPFVETWRFRWLANMEFTSYASLREAVKQVREAELEAERAKWPQMPEPPRQAIPGGYSSGCWLHRDVPRTHTAYVQVCWHKFDTITALLCAECAEQAKTDPGVVLRASAARRAHVAARKTASASIPEVSP